jgi:hypothetical protein
LTDGDLRAEVEELAGRIETLEQEQERLHGLPDAFAKLTGAFDQLNRIVVARWGMKDIPEDQRENFAHKANNFDTFMKFAIGFILPIILSVIAGYFMLKAAGLGASK